MPSRPKSKHAASLPVIVKHDKQPATRPVMLLVLGPHRSGTSLTARLLECLGAENSRNQLPPQPDNPTGFYEDSDVYAFGESVFLPKLQRRWDSVSPTDWSVLSKADRSRLGLQALEIIRRNYSLSNPLSVLKEPRINNTLPFWLSLLEHAGFDVRFVCVVRDPVSTARSLGKRNNFSLAHGGMVYLSSWLSVLPHLQEQQVSFVQFDEIFATPGKVLAKVADKLGLPLPEDFDQRVHAFTSAHLDPALRHSSLPREDVMFEPDLPPLVTELYPILLDAAQSQNVRKTAKFLAYADRQVENITPVLADYDAKQTRLSSLQTESQAATAECTRLQSQLGVSAQQNNAALVAERDALAARVSSLESEHSSLSTLHSALAARLSSLESEYSSLSTVHSSLIAERDDLATRHSPLVTALEQLQAEHSSLSTTHSSLVAERDAAAQERDQTRSERDALAQGHNQLIAERDGLTARLSSLESEHSSLVAERDAVAGRHQQLAAALGDLQARHSSLVAERDALVAQQTALRAAHEDATTRATELGSLRNELIARQAVESEMQTKLTTAEQALAEARSARERTEADAKDTAEENELLLSQLHQVQEELERYFLENRELKQRHDRLTASHASLVTERDDLATRVAALQSELTNGSYELQTKLLAEQNSLARAIKECDEAAREQDKLAAKLIKLEREHHALAKSEHSLKISHRKLEDRFARANAALALLKNAQDEAASLRASLASLESEHSDLAARHSSLATALEELQGQRSSLSTLNSSLVAERHELATRQASLTKERDELHSRVSALDDSLQARFSELAIAARALKEKEDRLQAIEPIIGQSGVSLLALEILDSHEQSPHRHLNIRVEGLRWESTSSPHDLLFRLVEHHGRPGVAIFETTPSSASGAWTSWQETGKEAGQTYVLVVPGDQHGARALREANGLDFYLLQFLITAARNQLERDIRDDGLPLHSKRPSPIAKSLLHAWHATAIALQAQLTTHANLLRFDTIGRVRWEHDAESFGKSTVQLKNIAFAGLFHRRAELQITINTSDSCLSFSNSPMFSALLPGCSPDIRASHRRDFGQSSRLQFPHTLSATGKAYLASLGHALPRIFLDSEHVTFDERIQEKEIRRRVLQMCKELRSLAS